MEKVNYHPFGCTRVVFQAAITRDVEAHNLYEKVMSLSALIAVGKNKIAETKRVLNNNVANLQYYKVLRAFNLSLPTGVIPTRHGRDTLRNYVKEYTEKLHVYQKELKKIYAIHNRTVEELKNAVDKFARTCAIRRTLSNYPDAGDIKGLPQSKEEQTLTTLNLSRAGVLTLIKKLSDEIKAKPTSNQFTVTINTGVTKG